MKTAYSAFIRFCANASAALALLAGGLGTLPIDSAHLPMPPEWRPYVQGTALLALSIRTCIIPMLDYFAKKAK